jgi:hypothetical protein
LANTGVKVHVMPAVSVQRRPAPDAFLLEPSLDRDAARRLISSRVLKFEPIEPCFAERPGRQRRDRSGADSTAACAIAAFWFAYVVTRPLGASFADWFAVPKKASGLDWGTGRITLVLTIVIVGLVWYLTKTAGAGRHSSSRRPDTF